MQMSAPMPHITPFSTAQKQNAADFCDDPYPFRVGESVRPKASIDKPVPTCGEMKEINTLVLARLDGPLRLVSLLLQGPITWGSSQARQFIFLRAVCVSRVRVSVETNALFYCGDCCPGYN